MVKRVKSKIPHCNFFTKNRKGQVTVFIVIAMIIVGATVLFFMFKDSLFSSISPSEKNQIYSFTEDCIYEVGNEVVYDIGRGGGYFFPPEKATYSGIAYYYLKGKNYMPSKEYIEKEISFWVAAQIFFCTKNFVDFSRFEVGQGDIKVETDIKKDKIILKVKYPLKVSQGEDISFFDNFEVGISARLGILYDSAANFIETQMQTKGIDTSKLLDLSMEENFYIDLLDYDEETVMFVFRDENSKIDGNPLRLVFANKYEVKE